MTCCFWLLWIVYLDFSTHWYQMPVDSSKYFCSGTTTVTWPRTNITNFAYIGNARSIACAVMRYEDVMFSTSVDCYHRFLNSAQWLQMPVKSSNCFRSGTTLSCDHGPKNRKNTHSVSDSDSFSTLPHGSNTFVFPVNVICVPCRFLTPVDNLQLWCSCS